MQSLVRYVFVLLFGVSSLQALVLPVEQVLSSTKSPTLRAYLAQETMPVVIKFFSPYCSPCNALGPIFEEFAHYFYGSIICIEVNVITNKNEKLWFGITQWPTLLFYEDGVELSRRSGAGLKLANLRQIASSTFNLAS